MTFQNWHRIKLFSVKLERIILQTKTSFTLSFLDNYNCLRETWTKNGMTVFKDILQYYNNKDPVPVLYAMQKMN